MNQIVVKAEERQSDRLTALLWCLDKQSVHLTRASILGGIIIMLKVFKLKLADTPFLPFKFGPNDTSLVVGVLGILMWGSLVGLWCYMQRIERLRAGHADPVFIAMMGEPDATPQGLTGILIGLAAIALCIVLFMVASYSLPDIKALLTAILFQAAK